MEEAWALLGNLGSPNITVAVVDNGFDLENPILKNRAYRPYDLRASSSALPSGDPNYTHGTAIASLAIGSQLANFSGVAPNVRFMPLHGTGFSVESAENIFNYTIRNDADVVVCAWGSIDETFKLDADKTSAIAKSAKDGRQGKGCVILFAAGNEGVDYVNYYAQHPDVICVGSTTSEDEHPDYANKGPEMTVCAVSNGGYAPLLAARASWDKGIEGEEGAAKFYYGDGIDRGEFMQHFGGTSGSVAIVGGVCALILSANPNLTAKEVKEILSQTADKIGSPSEYDEKGHSIKFGYGRVNAAAAVAEALQRLNDSQAQNVENEAIAEEKGPLSKKPETGYLRLYVPNQAELGKEYRCHVFLAYEAAQLVDTIKNTTDFVEHTIRVSETMTVELTNSTEPPTFKIQALSANTQLIDESSPTEWQFLMTPLHENNQSLVLSITKIEHIDNKEERKTVVYEESVEVIAPVAEKKEAEVAYLGPMDEETKQQIQDLIARAKLEEAINKFKKWADENGDEDLKNALLLQSARFSNSQKNLNIGLIDAERANMERSKLVKSILLLLNEAKRIKIEPKYETDLKANNDTDGKVKGNFSDQIKQLIIKNEIEIALNIFINWSISVNNKNLENDLVMLWGQYTRNEAQRVTYITNFEEAEATKSKIITAILHNLSESKHDLEKEFPDFEPNADPKNQHYIRQLISKDKLQEALDELTKLSNTVGTDEQKDNIVLIVGRYDLWKRNRNANIVSFEDENIEHARIVGGVLQLLSDIETFANSKPPQ